MHHLRVVQEASLNVGKSRRWLQVRSIERTLCSPTQIELRPLDDGVALPGRFATRERL